MTGVFSASFASFDSPHVPGYSVESLIGQGGHAAVYLARDAQQQPVALKIWLDPNLRTIHHQRVEREANALKALNHSNIAKFIELTVDDRNRPCLVLSYISGTPLSTKLKEDGPLSPEQAALLAYELCDVLSTLEAANLVHRDIKPSNVILRESDQSPVLIDFSVVKANSTTAPAQTALTSTGSSVGTRPYMAPEQCESDSDSQLQKVDHRTDIYGLGALLFHAITGVAPWHNESAWERSQRNPWSQPYPSHQSIQQQIKSQQQRVPPGLAWIVEKCLNGSKARRFQSASQLKQALGQHLGLIESTSRINGPFILVCAILLLFFVFFSQSWSVVPNPWQFTNDSPARNGIGEEKMQNAMTKNWGRALLPLIIVATGSVAEAQFYEDVQVPINPEKTRFVTKKAVRNLAQYDSKASRGSRQFQSNKQGAKPIAVPESVVQEFFRTTSKPLFPGQSWSVQSKLATFFMPKNKAQCQLTFEGFASIKTSDTEVPSLVLRLDYVSDSVPCRDYYYFAKDLGLVRIDIWSLLHSQGQVYKISYETDRTNFQRALEIIQSRDVKKYPLAEKFLNAVSPSSPVGKDAKAYLQWLKCDQIIRAANQSFRRGQGRQALILAQQALLASKDSPEIQKVLRARQKRWSIVINVFDRAQKALETGDRATARQYLNTIVTNANDRQNRYRQFAIEQLARLDSTSKVKSSDQAAKLSKQQARINARYQELATSLAQNRPELVLEHFAKSFFFIEANFNIETLSVTSISDFKQVKIEEVGKEQFLKGLKSELWPFCQSKALKFVRPQVNHRRAYVKDGKSIKLPANSYRALIPCKEQDAGVEFYLNKEGKILGMVKLDTNGNYETLLKLWQANLVHPANKPGRR